MSTYVSSEDDLSWNKGNGETHISSKETLPRLSTRPGVDSLLGRAAESDEKVFTIDHTDLESATYLFLGVLFCTFLAV